MKALALALLLLTACGGRFDDAGDVDAGASSVSVDAGAGGSGAHDARNAKQKEATPGK